MNNKLLRTLSLCIFLFTTVSVFGQKKSPAKYPSLLWEITGNGLKKPSYVFGTMHVSSKMVFHLSDSFYHAIKSVDAVALELNPDLWQNQMVQLDKMKNDYTQFTRQPLGDYLTESSFRIEKYDDMLQMAMSSEPVVVNNLLYRSYESKENFEEDTFLDLYIFQTGKKLGKRTTGVENYYEAERLVMEAYADMATEKKKKTVDMDGESMYDIQEKMQNAYRRGDLDLMDSLDIMVETSDAFREKFLYKRTEIQANSIDTILKKNSLFVGVGAAHLPGPRGIIELLRKKGYTLRPIKMVDRDAVDKETIDKMKVPVVFSKVTSEDGFYSVDVPGPLYKMSDEGKYIDRKQYSDMSNGSYYLVTRVKTHASFVGQPEDVVLKKVDSLLYENIPGKILSKKIITRNGYSGYDITNKTRRGDLQRFNIFVTPYEILVFKISGNENYIQGTEGDRFFSSIQLKENTTGFVTFSPEQGGFSIKFPQAPFKLLNNNTTDNMNRWEYEAVDKTNGDDYLVFNKDVYNFKFLDEDTFDLKLIEESFRSPDFFERQIDRQLSSFYGYPCLDVKELMKDSSVVTAHYIIKGPHYYIVAVRSKDRTKDFSNYFNSFQFVPYRYPKNIAYVDTFLNYAVTTPVTPQLDEHYRATLEKMISDVPYNYYSGYSSYSGRDYWPKERNAAFENDSTGEGVWISIQQYPHYYYKIDSSDFWKPQEISDYYEKKSFQLYNRNFIKLNDGSTALDYTLRDTGSSRMIHHLTTLKDDYLFNIVTLSDTLSKPSDFISSFWKTFTPQLTHPGRNIFIKCVDSFFNDLFSKDSATHAKAKQAIDNIYFNEDDVPKMVDAINRISITDKDYYDIKKELIEELGYVNDSTKPVVVNALKKIYEHTADTSTFQNAALTALTKHKTKDATALFKQLVLQDPPVFDNSNDYSMLFTGVEDSLQLAATLFPDILQLTALDDYKEPVTSLLVTLVDSGFVKSKQYEDYFDKIYFDAKIKLKKQQNEEQKDLEEKKAKEDDDESDNYYRYSDYDYSGNRKSELDDYAVLLIPFYDKNPNIPKFFDKLLRSTDKGLQLNTIVLLLRNNKPAPDSILFALAGDDKYRSRLYSNLDDINKLDKFPAKYKNQLDIARSNLLSERSYTKVDSIVFISKQPATAYKKKGIVYFFKYRLKKDDDWKIGISGLQPESPDSISADEWQSLTSMTDKKLRDDEPIDDQLQKQLKRALFISHNSGRYFFEGEGAYRFKRIGQY